MKLALRRSAPKDATAWQAFACWVIRARLVSDFCHGGIVIDGELYHATAARGLHKLKADEWEHHKWDLIEVDCDEERALSLFGSLEGAKYDWVSLLAFVGLNVNNRKKMYCFEWCWLAMAGEIPDGRVTPENLLILGLKNDRTDYF